MYTECSTESCWNYILISHIYNLSRISIVGCFITIRGNQIKAEQPQIKTLSIKIILFLVLIIGTNVENRRKMVIKKST